VGVEHVRANEWRIRRAYGTQVGLEKVVTGQYVSIAAESLEKGWECEAMSRPVPGAVAAGQLRESAERIGAVISRVRVGPRGYTLRASGNGTVTVFDGAGSVVGWVER